MPLSSLPLSCRQQQCDTGFEGARSLLGMHDCYNMVRGEELKHFAQHLAHLHLVEWERYLSSAAGRLRDVLGMSATSSEDGVNAHVDQLGQNHMAAQAGPPNRWTRQCGARCVLRKRRRKRQKKQRREERLNEALKLQRKEKQHRINSKDVYPNLAVGGDAV